MDHAQVLLAGALLAPVQCTVTAALHITGFTHLQQFHRNHRVLSAPPGQASRPTARLRVLVAAFVPDGPLVFGIDKTIEPRRSKWIAAKGTYRGELEGSRG